MKVLSGIGKLFIYPGKLLFRFVSHMVGDILRAIFAALRTNDLSLLPRLLWRLAWRLLGWSIVIGIVIFIVLFIITTIATVAITIIKIILLAIVVLLAYPILGIYAVLTFLTTNIFIGLDKLFYLGFSAPPVLVWAFWGLVIGGAIQACREMRMYGRKRLGTWIALIPVFLLCVTGTVKYVSALKSPSIQTTPIGTQDPSGLEMQVVEHTESDSVPTKQSGTEVEAESTTSKAPESTTGEQDIAPPPAKPSQPALATPKQETTTRPTPAPKSPIHSAPSEPVPTEQVTTESGRKPAPSEELGPTHKQQDTSPPPRTKPSESPLATPKQESTDNTDPGSEILYSINPSGYGVNPRRRVSDGQ